MNDSLLKTTIFPSIAVALLIGAISNAAAQTRTSESQAYAQKIEAERINDQKFSLLMSTVGVQTDLSNRFTPGQSYQSVRLQLVTNSELAAPSNSLAQAFSTSINSNERLTGELPRYRSFEMSSQHLVVITIDSTNHLRWWSLIPDPRILRAEEPDSNGRLSGKVLYQSNVEVILEIPDDAAAIQLRFYHPQWTDGKVTLVPVSSVALRKN